MTFKSSPYSFFCEKTNLPTQNNPWQTVIKTYIPTLHKTNPSKAYRIDSHAYYLGLTDLYLP